MRVTADTELIEIAPGGTGEVVLDIRNTGEVIEGVSARVIGIPEKHVTARPPLLPLFPDSNGQLTLAFGVPTTYPAGRHPLTVEVSTRGSGAAPTHIDVDLSVPARPDLRLSVRPEVVRARRRARFMLELHNAGNVPLDLELSAVDAERSLTATFTPSRLRVGPGEVASAIVEVRGPRLIFGQELDRPLTVHVGAEATPGDTAHPGDAPLARDVALTLRQRPMIPRGLLTALILASIVALWAAAFLLGLGRVLAGDPLTKSAPASYFTSTAGAASGADGQPAGVTRKDGPLAPGVGGMVTGTVRASTTGQGVGRIVVEALRSTRDGLRLVGSAATQTDGSYTIVGLFPGNYLLRFTATGYPTVWYPAAPAADGARPVSVAPGEATPGADVQISGLPATIRGSIDPGDTLTPVTATIVARALDLADPDAAAPVRTTTAADGSFVLADLPAPATYEVSLTTEGYQPTTVMVKVRGGQERFEPTVRLSAGAGSISGTVSDGRVPLGAVTVSTTVDGKDAATATPTTGTVGRFALTGLTTPATYVLTFAKDGYAPQTVVVDLGPGQHSNDLTVTLVGGTGTITGHLVDTTGKGIGGASVTVGGTATPAQTTTLTTGDVGLFHVVGLPTPGSYTLTFTKAGYAPQTVPLVLTSDAAPPDLSVTLPPALGRISGTVTGPGGTGVVGATVTAADGKTSWETTTVGASGGAPAGSYRFSDLRPGPYTVTVRAPGMVTRTAFITVRAGAGTIQDLVLTKAG